MKVKVLRDKDTKEFIDIITVGQIHMICTTNYPRLMTTDTTIKLLIDYYNKPNFNKIDFSNFELIKYDFINAGEISADIRNKLTSPKTLVALLKIYFDKKSKVKKDGILKLIKKEMKQTEKSIEYIADLL